MPNKFGGDSVLFIKTAEKDGRTVLEDSYFTAPFKVAKPFCDEETGDMSIMVMMASAGIMEGDSYKVNAELGKGSRLVLHGQSYNKIHRMKDSCALQHNRFVVNEGAFLDFAQMPVIPFKDSNFQSITECYLKKGSSFLYSDVLACGREKRGECFEFKLYKNINRIYYEGELIFFDNQLLCPKEQCLYGMGFFEGYTHQATLMYFSDKFEARLLESALLALENLDDIEYGGSMTKKHGMVIRILGSSSDRLSAVLKMIRDVMNGLF
ncbi:MAG TPA: urease accessory protein UreD [Clostridia bacterium]